MKLVSRHFDVIIIGASVAGCATGILLAQKGVKVALVEQRTSLGAYKKVCTHYLQPEVIPHLKKLGVWDEIMASGAVPSHMTARTAWGLVNLPHRGEQRGINLRRRLLDPILRKKAVSFSSVTLFAGYKLDSLLSENGRYNGVEICKGVSHRLSLKAPLVIGADGRSSLCARLAKVKESSVRNERFSYFALYKNLPDRYNGDTQVWIVDGGESYAAAFPNDSDLILISTYLASRHYAAWQGDVESHYQHFIKALPDGPLIDKGERVTPIFGMKKGDSIYRCSAVPGLALVGDAALAIDPLSGAGIMLAIQSASLLTQKLASTLVAGDKKKIDKILSQYRCKHRFQFGLTYWLLSRFSRAKTYHPITKFLLWVVVKVLGKKYDSISDIK